MSELNAGKAKHKNLVLPLLLITVGVIFIVYNLGSKNSDIWGILLRIWPLLFIYGGLEGLTRGRGIANSTFWIAFGLALLLSNYHRISWTAWEILFTFWPVFLVAIGIDLLFVQRSIRQRILASLLVISILGALALMFDSGMFSNPLNRIKIIQLREGVDLGSISLRPSLSHLKLYAQGSSSYLVEGEVENWEGEQIRDSYVISKKQGDFELESSGMLFIYEPGTSNRAEWNLGITSRIPVLIEIDQVIGVQNLVLTGLNVQSFDSSLVAGEINLTLPVEAQFDSKIELIIGQIAINVPRDVGFRLEGKPVLGSVRFPESYLQSGEDYVSPGFDEKDRKVSMRLEQIVGQVIIYQH